MVFAKPMKSDNFPGIHKLGGLITSSSKSGILFYVLKSEHLGFNNGT